MNLNQRFFQACETGNISVFNSLLTQGVNINYVQNNYSLLGVSVNNNHPEIYNNLINHHEIDINKKFSGGWTALHVACDKNITSAIQAICSHPLVSVNEKTDGGDTALTLAVLGGNVEAVRKLVTNDQVNLEEITDQERLNFNNGNLVHSFLTILGIIEEAKQERLRHTLNLLRLRSEARAEEADVGDGEAEAVTDDVRTILERVERVRADIMAKMLDYDEKKASLESLKRKHEKQREKLRSRQRKEAAAMEAKHEYQLDILQRQQVEEKVDAEREKVGTRQELEQLRSSLDHLLDATPAPPPCPTCPVCFESLKPPVRILQCINGHLVCERCRAQPQVEVCPTCRKYIVGRATAMEQHLRALFQCGE